MASATVRRRDTLALIIPQPGVSGPTRFPARPPDRLARPPRPVAKSGASASAPRTERCRSPFSRLAQPVLVWFDLAVLNVGHRIARWRLTSTHYACEELHPSRTHLSPTCSILRARVVASSAGPLPARMPHTRADSSRLVRSETTTHHSVARPRGSPHSENIAQARRQ